MEKLSSHHDDTDALDALGEKVKAAQDARIQKVDDNASGWAIGVRYASEFSAAVIVGGLLGYGIDYFAGSTPWALLVGILFGFMAGTRNIVRLAKEMSVETVDGENSTK